MFRLPVHGREASHLLESNGKKTWISGKLVGRDLRGSTVKKT